MIKFVVFFFFLFQIIGPTSMTPTRNMATGRYELRITANAQDMALLCGYPRDCTRQFDRPLDATNYYLTQILGPAIGAPLAPIPEPTTP